MAKKDLVSYIEVSINEKEHDQLRAEFTVWGARRGVNLLLVKYGNSESRISVQMDIEDAKDLRDALDSVIRHSEAEAKRHGDT